MNLHEGKSKFIEAWGKMASEWGINRTMAQVHALLLVTPDALTADEVMEQLDISRGNVNMNLRALIDWGLVHKSLRPGERKEFFFAEKDMWTVVRQIIVNRKKRELEPMIKVLDDLADVQEKCPESEAFVRTIGDIRVFAHKANQMLDMLVETDANTFGSIFLGMPK